jgi:conjugative transfer signal peptidase TraF
MTPHRFHLRVALGAAGAAAVLGGLAAVAHQTGVVINTTASLPLGLYRAIPAPVARGAYVKFCPPPSALFDEAARRGYLHAGFCPGGYGPLLKRVLAVAGDRVQVAGDGVRIDGRLIPLSAPMWADGGGRTLPRYAQDRILNASELMLMSDVSLVSFDARYFGPVDRAQVQSVIEASRAGARATSTAPRRG